MNHQLTREDARSALIRAGLSVSEDRLDLLAPGIQVARASAASLAVLRMGYGGPASFRAPPPADGERAHGN